MRSVCDVKSRREQSIVVGESWPCGGLSSGISGYLAGVTASCMRWLIEDGFGLHGRAFKLDGWVRMFEHCGRSTDFMRCFIKQGLPACL